MRILANTINSKVTDSTFEWSSIFLDDSHEILRLRILVLVLITLLLASSMCILIIRRKHARKIDSLQIASLQNKLKYEEDMRNFIGTELHDKMGGLLSTVKLHFKHVENEHILEDGNYLLANELLDDACEEIRKISHSLSSIKLLYQRNFLLGLMEQIDSLELIFTIHYNFHVESIRFYETSDHLHVLRIFQELFSNIVRHSTADEIWIHSKTENNFLCFVLEENGEGFDENQIKKGLGFLSMNERINVLDGAIIRYTNEQGKFCTKLKIPLKKIK